MTYHRICILIKTTDATSGIKTVYPSGAPEFTPVFSGVRVTLSLVLCVCFVDRCLSFFFWSLYCLSFFDLPLLISSFMCMLCRSLFVLLSFFFDLPLLISSFMCMLCRSLFVLLSFFFWSLYFLSFLE